MIEDVQEYRNIKGNGRNTKEPNGICRAKDAVPKMKNSLDRVNSSSATTAEDISDLKNIATQALQDEEKY